MFVKNNRNETETSPETFKAEFSSSKRFDVQAVVRFLIRFNEWVLISWSLFPSPCFLFTQFVQLPKLFLFSPHFRITPPCPQRFKGWEWGVTDPESAAAQSQVSAERVYGWSPVSSFCTTCVIRTEEPPLVLHVSCQVDDVVEQINHWHSRQATP